MPSQSRGFWTCDLCSRPFDTAEDALYHERRECPQQQQQSHKVYSGEGAPVDPRHYEGDPPPAQQHAMMPMPYEAAPSGGGMYDVHRHRLTPPRTLALIRPNESTELWNVDSVALTNVELFEGEISPGGLNRVVGMRCLQCGERQQPHPHHVNYPSNVENVGYSLRSMVKTHLIRCPLVSGGVRDFLREGVGSIPEESLGKLTEHCVRRCHELGVVNKYPQSTGIVFRDELPVFGPGARPAEQQYAQQYSGYETYPYGQAAGYPLHAQVHRPEPMIQPRPVDASTEKPTSGPYREAHHATFEPPVNYPFEREPNGTWVCKYCVNIRIEFRDPKFLWRGPDPPSNTYIDSHFEHCQGYQTTIRPSYAWEGNLYQSTFAQPAQYMRGQQVGFGSGDARHVGASLPFSPSTDDSYHARSNRRVQEPPAPEVTRLQLDEAGGDSAHTAAMQYLRNNDKSILTPEGAPLPISEQLVYEEDKLLLTDYFFFAMKQLRKVHFTEADRKTRGGKRENIPVGYGGLQCVHCVDQQNARKFFWSNVDRLANSFAEIPSHVKRCRHCPEPVKQALAKLHERHSKQMNPLPRGSQKIFFRRVWRRLHPDTDLEPETDVRPPPIAVAVPASMSPASRSTKQEPHGTAVETPPKSNLPPPVLGPSPARTEGSDESVLMLERSTEEAAKALASGTFQAGPPSPNSRILLSIPNDKEWISDTDSYIRRQIEVFCATAEDVKLAEDERKFPIHEGQVGIRCLHCAMQKDGPGAVMAAVMYPFSISAIYENVREFQRNHFDSCPCLPPAIRSKYQSLKGSSSLSSVLRNYYDNSAKALGLYDTKKGIRAGADRSSFVFNVSEAMRQDDSKGSPSKKRKGEDVSDGTEQTAKKSAYGDRQQFV